MKKPLKIGGPLSLIVIYSPRMAPEKQLWLEVLLLALSDFCGLNHVDKRYPGRKISRQRAAAEWFQSPSNELGSFLFVAHTLDVDPSAVRKVLRMVDTQSLRERLKRQCGATRTRSALGIEDPAFECNAGRRVKEIGYV